MMAIVVDLARDADFTRDTNIDNAGDGNGQFLLRQSVVDIHVPEPHIDPTPPTITATEDSLQPEITYAAAS